MKTADLLKVRCDGREMINSKTEEIYFTDFYVIGNYRQALRKQIALAVVYHLKAGDEWWVGDEKFAPVKQMKGREEIIAFLQPFVDQDTERLTKLVMEAGAKK